MPANCSSDLMLAIEHIDSILINGSSTDIENLKTMFGLGTVVHNTDFAQYGVLPSNRMHLNTDTEKIAFNCVVYISKRYLEHRPIL